MNANKPGQGNRHKNSIAEFLILRLDEHWLLLALLTAMALIVTATESYA